MNTSLYKIVYCSKNLISGNGAEQDGEILQILSTARVNNHRQSITGALLFNAGYFAQVLEGPQGSIERIFERIQQDPRHGEVTVLDCGAADGRSFGEWAMAHVRLPHESEAKGISSTLQAALLNPAGSGEAILDLLRSLVIQED